MTTHAHARVYALVHSTIMTCAHARACAHPCTHSTTAITTHARARASVLTHTRRLQDTRLGATPQVEPENGERDLTHDLCRVLTGGAL